MRGHEKQNSFRELQNHYSVQESPSFGNIIPGRTYAKVAKPCNNDDTPSDTTATLSRNSQFDDKVNVILCNLDQLKEENKEKDGLLDLLQKELIKERDENAELKKRISALENQQKSLQMVEKKMYHPLLWL